MRTIYICLFLFSLSARSQTPNCNKTKNGNFYFYPTKSTKSFLIIRDGTSQQEIDLNTKDTSFWKVNWPEDCVLTTQFLKTTKTIPEDQANFLKSHVTVIEIQKVTNKYYTFLGSIDVNGTKMGQTQDTIWFRQK